MVMGRRPDVSTAPASIAAFTVGGLAGQLITTIASVPFRKPWQGESDLVDNIGQAVTRQVMRSFMGYAMSLPTPEFRSLEMVIDDLCRVVLPPFVHHHDVDMQDATIAGVPGIWYRPRGTDPVGTMLYLHGGGYIGTSPRMYSAFVAKLAQMTDCDVFVADYRLAPEFPFPAALLDVMGILDALFEKGIDPDTLFVAGDSGGGGLAVTMLLDARAHHIPPPAGLILFSPEVDLTLDEPSVQENASHDILPWNIPTEPYLHGIDSHNKYISTINADVEGFPPTFVAYGDAEMFRDPIRRFVTHLKSAGVPTTTVAEADMFHVFPILMPWSEAAHDTFRALGTFVSAQVNAPRVTVRPES